MILLNGCSAFGWLKFWDSEDEEEGPAELFSINQSIEISTEWSESFNNENNFLNLLFSIISSVSNIGISFDNISPIDGNVINKVSLAQQEDVDLAVSKARETFNKGHWSNLSPGQRKKILFC